MTLDQRGGIHQHQPNRLLYGSNSLLIIHAAGFAQDRAVLENIYTSGNGSVIREVRVQGTFYQVL